MVIGSWSGFSWKPMMRPSSSTWTMPNWDASDFWIGRQATVAMAPFWKWKSVICRMFIL